MLWVDHTHDAQVNQNMQPNCRLPSVKMTLFVVWMSVGPIALCLGVTQSLKLIDPVTMQRGELRVDVSIMTHIRFAALPDLDKLGCFAQSKTLYLCVCM
jgi:hypothetical protein